MYKFKYRLLIPAFVFIALIAGGALLASIFPTDEEGNRLYDNQQSVKDFDGREPGVPEDMIAAITNQFQMGDRHYILASEETRIEFQLPEAIRDEDIGSKLITITTSVDEKLIGKEVYEFLPAGSEAVVAVKMEDGYKLFRFFTFESYINNQDEDVIDYLNLYGITKAEDIKKVQLIGHSEEAKIAGTLDIIHELTDSAQITNFYNFYSVIKDSSKAYFDQLFNTNNSDTANQTVVPEDKPEQDPTQIAPDYQDQNPTQTAPDSPASNQGSTEVDYDIVGEANDSMAGGGSQSSSTEGSVGAVGNALSNSVTIRIYNQYGLYFDAEYYPNISFISRHEVNDEFAAYLDGLIK